VEDVLFDALEMQAEREMWLQEKQGSHQRQNRARPGSTRPRRRPPGR
jgi:hypothetical protein